MRDTIPSRSEIKKEDTWDLSKLFPGDASWYSALKEYETLTEKIPGFRGTLGKSAESLTAYLDFARDFGILEEKLAYYSDLRQTEDEGDSAARTMTGKFTMAAARAQTAGAWAAPEIQAIPDEVMNAYLAPPRPENPEDSGGQKTRIPAEYLIYLKRLLRYKPHILGEKEERIIALHAEGEGLSNEAFSLLTNVDMNFGTLDTPGGPKPLSQSSWAVFMESQDRSLRRDAYTRFYSVFEAHQHTLASLYSGSVKQDAIRARTRNYPSARAAALFYDNVGEEVYDNLISSISANLEPLHRYYALRRKKLAVPELRHYDVYAPLTERQAQKTSWEEAVNMVSEALSPLGPEYVDTLRSGLLGRWADRYENKGKRSGAFSAGSYTGEPYILMNYKEDSLRDVFTMAHEGGHSMHSWYSARNNPFMHYGYTIFEAEVASTFNEELLFRHLLKSQSSQKLSSQKLSSREFRAWLVNKRADDLLSTLYRQTMFAEYEKITHQLEEAGEPLTVDVLRSEYRKLLEKYFGPGMVFEENSDLEGLRIPHFYRAFYVYKYSTGVSAALALAERVLSGGREEREDYFAFLKSGGSRFPIDSLKLAGVDMSSPEPVEAACRVFGTIVDELESLL